MEEKENKVSTKKCKFCVSDIPLEAKRCPQCHADLRKWSKRHPVLIVILLLITIWISLSVVTSFYKLYKTSMTEIEARNDPSKAILELESFSSNRTGDFAITEGQVKNISKESQKSVMAIVQWYDKNEKFITSDEALIDYNPILPGQTSPFTIHTTHNPEMYSFNVSFKHILGGTIPTNDVGDVKK